jgi:hypothetical protein
MKAQMNRRELLVAIGITTLIGCRRSERQQPERSEGPDSTVTLIVDGMF